MFARKRINLCNNTHGRFLKHLQVFMYRGQNVNSLQRIHKETFGAAQASSDLACRICIKINACIIVDIYERQCGK